MARILNIVLNDEIWKVHIRHENVSQRHNWPATWGYLVQEYHTLNSLLEGRSVSRNSRPSSRCRSGEVVKLPQITVPERSKTFPTITSQLIGWKSTKNGRNSELVHKYGGTVRGKCTLTRRLNWPRDSLP